MRDGDAVVGEDSAELLLACAGANRDALLDQALAHLDRSALVRRHLSEDSLAVLGTCSHGNLLILLVQGCPLKGHFLASAARTTSLHFRFLQVQRCRPLPRRAIVLELSDSKETVFEEVENMTSLLLSLRSTMELRIRGVDAWHDIAVLTRTLSISAIRIS
jgi:hypothetical protein